MLQRVNYRPLRPVAVTIDGILIPHLGHELSNAARTRGAHRPRIPTAFGCELGGEHTRGHHRAALGRLEDHGLEICRHRDDATIAQEVYAAEL